MKYYFLLAVAVCLFSCDSSGNKTSNKGSDSVSTDTSSYKKTAGKSTDTTSAETPKSAKTAWAYSEEVDKMTSGKKYFASVDANELLQFDFPYDGGSTATLTIRKNSSGTDAILAVSKGQFNIGIDGAAVKIRFDSEQPIVFSASSASDGSTEVLFINNAKKLIKKLKTAQKIIVQAEFYDAGFKEMEFEVAGFQWAH